MIGNHLTHEQLTDLLYGAVEADQRTHLANCTECQEQYGDLASALECLNRLPVPQQTAEEKTDVFRRAWQSSPLSKEKHPASFLWPVLRHAASFGFGLACGILLLVMTISPFEAKGEQTGAKPESARMEIPVPPMLQGTPAERVYSQLENPVILVHPEKPSQNSPQQVLEGTTEDGKVQIVWNLQ